MDTGSEIPLDVARVVVSPQSYANDAVIYPAFRWLRHNMPLGVARVPGYDPLWIVTKYADIREIERNPRLFHNADFNPILNDRASDDFTRSINHGSLRTISTLVFMDPPEHAAYKGVTANYFMPARVARLEQQIRVLARQSVENLLSFDGECDFVRDFALHYPLRVIMTMLGVPPEDEPRMLKLTQELFGGHDPEEQRAGLTLDPVAAARQWSASLQDFYLYFSAMSADRRRSPQDDLLSLIANSKVNGEPIGEAEANGYYVAIATAGHDTTSSSTTGGMHGLATFPGQFDAVRSDPALVPGLVDEAIRWTSPVKHFMRNATADTVVRGMPIKAMDRLMICYPSGNRDEEMFADADAFDVRRSPNAHVGFGYGPHTCLGQHLAKLEMRILFEELLPNLRQVEMNGAPKLVQTNFVGGYKSLPIRFRKR